MPEGKLFPGAASLGIVSLGRIAMTVDGKDGTETKDFWGESSSKVIDGVLHIEIKDAPPIGKKNEPYIRAILTGIAKAQGVEVGIDANGEDSVLIFAGGERLPVQMVTVPADNVHWAAVSKGGPIVVDVPVEEAAAWIHSAIEKKQNAIGPKERTGILLALDSRHGAQLAHDQVVEAFHRQFGDGSAYGFKQIWLVGPVPGRSRQLYPAPK